MKSCFAILSLVFCLTCVAAEAPKSAPAKDAAKSSVSKRDRKEAEKEFKSALDLQRNGKPEEAWLAANKASELIPGNVEYLALAEQLRQQLVGQHLENGNRLAAAGDNAGAAKEFRTALGIDPANAFVAQRLNDVAPPEDVDPEHTRTLQLLASVDQINLQPAPGKKSFHLQGDTRQIYNQIGTAFGINMSFDQTLNTRVLRFDIDNVDFYTVTALLGKMTKTFWAPIASRDAMVANDTQEMRKTYERMALRTFYVNNAVAPTELQDLANVLRNIFDLRLVALEPGKNTITVRGPHAEVEVAASLLENLMEAKPELTIDVKEYEIDTDNLRDYGANLPTSFTVFNIPSEIRKVLGPNAQAVIDQLNATGTIDPSKIPTADLANLAGSPLLAPFIFFGGGNGLTGVSTPPITATLSLNKSIATNLEHMLLRATDGEAANFMVGTRFPVVTSTFANVAVTATGQQSQIGNTPQFTYVDLGVTLKATPHYHSDGRVTLLLDLAIQALGATRINGIPDILTRSYKGAITVTDGEPSAITGAISEQETRSIQGFPVLSQLPGLSSILSSNSKERIHNEILIVITPHVVRRPFHDKGSSVFWNLGP
jgi:type II secretory pathway component GspD/PulD (secretin)